jgi:hypothetical protein
VEATNKNPDTVSAMDFANLIRRIDLGELSTDRIKERQGNAGIAAIRRTIDELIFS